MATSFKDYIKFGITFTKNSKYSTFKSTILLMTDEWKYRFCSSDPKIVKILKNRFEEVLNRKINFGDSFDAIIDINEIAEVMLLAKNMQRKVRQPMCDDFHNAIFQGRKCAMVVDKIL